MSLDLETTIAEFRRWHRGNKSGRVPNHLKQKVIELCDHYSPEQLARCLALNVARINVTLHRLLHKF